MNNIQTFISDIENDLQSELNNIKLSIIRIDNSIKDASDNIMVIEESMDSTYNVLSASQTNNSRETTEISAFNNIINNRKSEREKLIARQEYINLRLNTIHGFKDMPSVVDVDKLKFIVGLIDVDPDRAKSELSRIIGDLKGKE